MMVPRSPSARARPSGDHRPPPSRVGPGKPTCRCPWWPRSVNQGRPPKDQGEPTSLGWTPARPWPIQTASRRAAGLARLDRAAVDLVDVHGSPDAVVGHPTGALDEPGMAAAQAGHPESIAAGCGDQQLADAAVQPRRGPVTGRPAPGRVGEGQAGRRPSNRPGGRAVGCVDGGEAAGDQAAECLGVRGGQHRQHRHHHQHGQPTTRGGTTRRRPGHAHPGVGRPVHAASPPPGPCPPTARRRRWRARSTARSCSAAAGSWRRRRRAARAAVRWQDRQ